MSKRKDKHHGVLIYLSDQEHETFVSLCRERGQTRADFLRSAIAAANRIPIERSHHLYGACLTRHEARLMREKRAAETPELNEEEDAADQ